MTLLDADATGEINEMQMAEALIMADPEHQLGVDTTEMNNM